MLRKALDNNAYDINSSINGITRQQSRAALNDWQNIKSKPGDDQCVEYSGGELFAATHSECKILASMVDDLWQWQIGQPKIRGFLEEAHFLSILYAARGYKNFTANPFIKRMWTTFKVNNIEKKDLDIDIWHLPAEKKSGFHAALRRLVDSKLPADPGRLSTILPARWEFRHINVIVTGTPPDGGIAPLDDRTAVSYGRSIPRLLAPP